MIFDRRTQQFKFCCSYLCQDQFEPGGASVRTLGSVERRSILLRNRIADRLSMFGYRWREHHHARSLVVAVHVSYAYCTAQLGPTLLEIDDDKGPTVLALSPPGSAETRDRCFFVAGRDVPECRVWSKRRSQECPHDKNSRITYREFSHLYLHAREVMGCPYPDSRLERHDRKHARDW